MNNEYIEQIKNNKNKIIELENTMKKMNGDIPDKSDYDINYDDLDQMNIIEEQIKYIGHLYELIDIQYQSLKIANKKKREEAFSRINVNRDFKRLYSLGRFYYNDRYYPINSVYIKVYKNSDNTDCVYQLLSTVKDGFSIYSNNNVDISTYNYTQLFKFRDCSVFKELYTNKDLCNILDININTKEKEKLLIDYLKKFDEKEYDFFKELEKNNN